MIKKIIKKNLYNFLISINKVFINLLGKNYQDEILSALYPFYDKALILDINNDIQFNSICKKIDKKILKNHKHQNLVSLYTTYQCMGYVIKNNIKGDIIESGVANGRQICLILEILKNNNIDDYNIILYDTFKGMVKPGKFDHKTYENDNRNSLRNYDLKKDQFNASTWQAYSLDEVKENLSHIGYPENRIRYIVGNVIETIPDNNHEYISFLRLDTDFYDSTKVELEYLFSKVVKGGVIILDDYGAWAGVKKATDEYFKNNKIFPLLNRTSFKERVFIKI